MNYNKFSKTSMYIFISPKISKSIFVYALTYYSLILFDAATAKTVWDTATVHQGQ